jgi:Ca-activated chloride channel family protein
MTFHLLRPFWLLSFIPLALLSWQLFRQSPALQAWHDVCDAHLLPHLIEGHATKRYTRALLLILTSLTCLILSLTGPTFSRLPVPVYQQQRSHILLIDTSNTMLATDLSPNRLQRAKFKLHDLFQRTDQGQFALIAYTGEPFLVSPLTDDAQTIDALLQSLTPDIMPVGGNRLDAALQEAHELMTQSGIPNSDILILTAEAPTPQAIDLARQLAHEGLSISVLPMTPTPSPAFHALASAGNGHVILLSNTSRDLDQWLSQTQNDLAFQKAKNDTIPRWRDEGRWLLIPALLCLLPLFRRDWLQRIRP